jgi:LysM repeat protein
MTIIRVGDKCDLWSIAKRYDSSIAVITEVNELNDDKPIKANEILMIPRLR